MGSVGWALVQFILRRKEDHREETAIYKPRREALEETSSAKPLDLGLLEL